MQKKEKIVLKTEDGREVVVRCSFDKIVNISELKKHPKNRNEHPKEQIEELANIILYQGWRKAVTVSNRSGFMTAGHGRLLIAEYIGLKQVPVDFQDYDSEEQEYSDVQSDNAIALWSKLDLKSIRDDVVEYGPDFNLKLLGIKDFELVPADKFGGKDPDTIPETSKNEFGVKLGQVWVLGKHRLMCGDATNLNDLKTLCGDQEIDLWLTDPPYNVDYEGKTKESLKIENDKMGDSQFLEFLEKAFLAASEVMRKGAVFYIWHADSEGFNFRYALRQTELELKQNLIWNKNSMVMGRQDYHWKHEPCLYGWKKGAAHYWGTDRKQTTVLEFERPRANREHPTMKPIELMKYQILNSSKQGWAVLDSFGGSGSTLIASEALERRCFAMELDPHYCSVIIKRWQDLTSEKAEILEV